MTRAEIVQKLLDEDKITAAEAVVLLTPEDSQVRPTTYLPYQPRTWPSRYPAALPASPRPLSRTGTRTCMIPACCCDRWNYFHYGYV